MSAKAEIISIGDELLYGQTLNTNAHWMSNKLDEYNIKVFQRTTIGDNEDQILNALKLIQIHSRMFLHMFCGNFWVIFVTTASRSPRR